MGVHRRGQVISFDVPDEVSVTLHRSGQWHDRLCTPNIVVRDVEEADSGASIAMYQVLVSPSRAPLRAHTSRYVLPTHKGRRRGAGEEHGSTRARGRVASLSGRHRRVLGEIDRPILSATLLRSRMSSQSRYGTRSGGSAPGRLASEVTLTKYGHVKHAEATAVLEGVHVYRRHRRRQSNLE